MFDQMTVNTPRDFLCFLSMFVSGIAVGVLFDVFRSSRRVWKSGLKLTSFEDIIFLAGAFLIFSYAGSLFDISLLRWYVFAGAFLGVLIYFLTLSKYFSFVFQKFFFYISVAVSCISKTLKNYVFLPFKNLWIKIKLFSSGKIFPLIRSVKGFAGEKKIFLFSKNIFTREKK